MNENLKQLCDRCGFMVKVDGHEGRCRVPGALSDKVAVSGRAWYGDTVHRLDVQLVARIRDLPRAQCELFAQQFTANAAMAEYYRGFVQAVGLSDHSVGTLFESQYDGAFRQLYLQTVFPEEAERVLSLWSPPSLD